VTQFEREYRDAYPDDEKMDEIVGHFLRHHGLQPPDGRCIHRGRLGRRCKSRAGVSTDRWWCSKHCPLCNRLD